MNKITVPEKIENERIDAVLAGIVEGLSRSNIRNRLDYLSVNGVECKPSKKITAGDIIAYSLKNRQDTAIEPENVELDIIYEDENVFVINKPSGMVVHPAAGNYNGTMAQGIMYRLQESDSDFDDSDTRPGIVHRLDKDTSGIIIAAKNNSALEHLTAQFRRREVEKTYLAVINGRPPEKAGRIETLIGRDPKNRKKMTWKVSRGKTAITEYRLLRSWKKRSLIALDLKTGRTHQLRVHMLSINAPIAGDPVYSRRNEGLELMLHAYRLKIRLPGETEKREFRAPLPERFKKLILSTSNED